VHKNSAYHIRFCSARAALVAGPEKRGRAESEAIAVWENVCLDLNLYKYEAACVKGRTGNAHVATMFGDAKVLAQRRARKTRSCAAREDGRPHEADIRRVRSKYEC
jgi:hypothetical protein